MSVTHPPKPAARHPWFGVELRHLAALAAVAREQSFRGAADSLGYVQSAVSQQLAQLEQVVGERLVERERGSATVALTPAGELLLDHAQTILSCFGAAQADFEALSQGGLARLRLGACASLAPGIFRRVLPRLLGRTPELHLEVEEGPPAQLAAQVADGALDAAFAELPLPDGAFRSADLCTDSYVLLVRRDTVSDAPGPPTPAELAELVLIEHPLMQGIEPRLRALGTAPRYGLRSRSYAALSTLVASGAGSAIVPEMLLAETDEEIVALPLDEVIPPRRVCVFWHAGRETVDSIEAFVELARWVCGPLGPDAQPPGDRWARLPAAA